MILEYYKISKKCSQVTTFFCVDIILTRSLQRIFALIIMYSKKFWCLMEVFANLGRPLKSQDAKLSTKKSIKLPQNALMPNYLFGDIIDCEYTSHT